MTEVSVITQGVGSSRNRRHSSGRNDGAVSFGPTPAEVSNREKRCTCNLDLGGTRNENRYNPSMTRNTEFDDNLDGGNYSRHDRSRRTTTVTARPAPNSSYIRGENLSGSNRNSNSRGVTKVVLPPQSLDPNETTVIHVEDGELGGTFLVDSSHDVQVNLNNPPSQITFTPRSKDSAHEPCLNPTNCKYMQSLNQSELFENVAARQDQLRLQAALTDAMKDAVNMTTFDEVEEMLEIQNCNEIQMRLNTLIKEKRDRLRKRAARKEAELYERKKDIHKNLIQRISDERQDHSRMHRELLAALEDTYDSRTRNAGNSGREEVEVSISRSDIPRYSRDQPLAHSTQIMSNVEDRREPRLKEETSFAYSRPAGNRNQRGAF